MAGTSLEQYVYCGGLSDLSGEPVVVSAQHLSRRPCKLACVGALLLLLALFGQPSAAQPEHGTWQRLGPEGGQVVSLAAGPDGTLFLGTPDGHIFTSRDRARHWELRGRVSHRLDAVVKRLLVDTRSPQRLFAAVWFQDPSAGGGIFRSEDAGRTWSLAGLGGEAVRALEQSVLHAEILVAGTRTGIFRSGDFGNTWARISPLGDLELRNIDSLAFDPRDPRTIYAGTYHLPWKTTDAGKTWAPVAAGMIDDSDVMALRVDARDPAHLFASACSGIYRTENGGGQWTKLEGVPYAARRTHDIVQDPADARFLYAGTTEGLWITRDSGESWTRATPRDWVVNAIAVLPERAGQPSRVVVGTEDGGIQASDDAGLHFVPANTGFAHSLVLAFAADPIEPGHWLARFGSSGQPLLETRDAGQTWQVMPPAPSLLSAAHFFGTAKGWFAAPAVGGLLRYDDSTRQWRALRFLPPPAVRSKRKANPRSSKQPGVGLSSPVVHDLRIQEARLIAATSNGIWFGDSGASTLRLFSSSLVADTSSLDSESSGVAFRLWSITSAGLSEVSASGQFALARQLPEDAGDLRWVHRVGPPGKEGLLVGTVHGVYWRAAESRVWQHFAAGLPAAELLPLSLSPPLWIAAGKAGGLYVSGDAGASWSRLDGPGEASYFLAAAPEGAGFVVSSRTEGLLQWRPGASP